MFLFVSFNKTLLFEYKRDNREKASRNKLRLVQSIVETPVNKEAKLKTRFSPRLAPQETKHHIKLL